MRDKKAPVVRAGVGVIKREENSKRKGRAHELCALRLTPAFGEPWTMILTMILRASIRTDCVVQVPVP